MDSLFVLKGQLQKIYAAYSQYIDKVIRFVLALVTYYTISSSIGFMKTLANPAVTLVLSLVCTFLPVSATVIIAAGLVLVHMFYASLGMVAVTTAVFAVMFIFYIRFSPKTAFIILLMPVAFMLKIPYVIPVACGLLAVPSYLIPMVCGLIVYYLIHYVKSSAASLKGAGASDILGQVTTFVQQVFKSKEMWITVAAFVICLLVVYRVRRMSVDHSWKLGAAAGAVVNIVVIAAGDIIMNIPASYGGLILGNIAAFAIGLVLELLFFSVDYSRGERLQFEDDDYYYYVKAVPKITVAAPEKTVKRISGRHETEIIDAGEIRRKAQQKSGGTDNRRPVQQKQTVQQNRPVRRQVKSSKVTGNTEHLLLTQSLRKELDLDKK